MVPEKVLWSQRRTRANNQKQKVIRVKVGVLWQLHDLQTKNQRLRALKVKGAQKGLSATFLTACSLRCLVVHSELASDLFVDGARAADPRFGEISSGLQPRSKRS